MPIINIKSKSVYGSIKFYPAGAAAQLIADTAGTKTIEPRILKMWADFGSEVLIVEGDCTEAREILAAWGI